MPPLQFVFVVSPPFSFFRKRSLCLLPGTSVPLKPLPISKPLVAGMESIAWARTASILSNTGSPSPEGTFRITQVTVPPIESEASLALIMRCDDIRLVKAHILLTDRQEHGFLPWSCGLESGREGIE